LRFDFAEKHHTKCDEWYLQFDLLVEGVLEIGGDEWTKDERDQVEGEVFDRSFHLH
jgi:hypothetical protein